MQNAPLFQHFMLSQFAMGATETAFNGIIARSPHILPILRKLVGKVLKITLTQPEISCFILFSENRTDWLQQYEGDVDCSIELAPSALPQLVDKSKLTALINNKTLILNGDIQVLQLFITLLDQLEKDPAELLSPLIGDVAAQVSTNLIKGLFNKVNQQVKRNSEQLVDNLMNERPVLVHRLEAVNFYDEVSELAQQADRLEQKFAIRGL
ncbi:ubiquinone biosynthesis accessory factor UbiJ [Ursidibacter sp. B-7004-1]